MENNTVTIPWQSQKDIWWNETCAKVMEHFGVPGSRYRTEVSTSCMKFHFETEQDALMCKLLISDKI